MGLAFGYNKGLPEGVTAAWGCRMIAHTEYTDFLADRTGRFGDEEDLDRLFAWLDGEGAMNKARRYAEELLRDYRMHGGRAEHFVLYEDEKGVVVGNTNGSGGYLYVSAWLKDAVPVASA